MGLGDEIELGIFVRDAATGRGRHHGLDLG